MVNPDGNGVETFNKDTWASVVNAATYDIQKDWQEYNHATLADEYMENRVDENGNKKYVVMPSLPYAEGTKDTELSLKWENCAKTIRDYTWRAIEAKSDGEFAFHVNEMKRLVNSYGMADCIKWCEEEAARKWQMTLDLQALTE